MRFMVWTPESIASLITAATALVVAVAGVVKLFQHESDPAAHQSGSGGAGGADNAAHGG